MKIVTNQSGATLTVALEGRLDTTTAPELEEVVMNRLDGVSELTMDFSDLSYISSAGLRVLFAAHRKMAKQGTMKVIHVNEIVREVFEVTGFSEILTIE